MKNKTRKQTLKRAQYQLEIIFNTEAMTAEITACVLFGCLY